VAKPTTALGTKLRILLGDSATPIVYTAFCGLTARSINFQTNTNDFFVPDCDNPDDPAWREMAKAGRFVSITGSGILDTKSALPRMQAAYGDADPVPVRVELAVPTVDGGGAWTGLFMFTGLEITGNDGELVTANITMESDGPVVWA
jgi:predicted secreted protein